MPSGYGSYPTYEELLSQALANMSQQYSYDIPAAPPVPTMERDLSSLLGTGGEQDDPLSGLRPWQRRLIEGLPPHMQQYVAGVWGQQGGGGMGGGGRAGMERTPGGGWDGSFGGWGRTTLGGLASVMSPAYGMYRAGRALAGDYRGRGGFDPNDRHNREPRSAGESRGYGGGGDDFDPSGRW